jgi:hypothetical protein
MSLQVFEVFALMVMAKHFPKKIVRKRLRMSKFELRCLTLTYNIKWEAVYFNKIIKLIQTKDEELQRMLVETLLSGRSLKKTLEDASVRECVSRVRRENRRELSEIKFISSFFC